MSSPIDWPAIELALRGLVVEAAAASTFDLVGVHGVRVFWTEQDHPVGDRPFVTLRTSGTNPLAPPARFHRDRVQVVDVVVATAATQTYTVTAAGVVSTYTAGALDDVDDIRDGLIAAITLDQGAATGGPFCSAAIQGTGTLRITAATAGLDLFVTVDPDPDITATIVLEASETLNTETEEFSLSVQAFAVYDDDAPSRSQHAKNLAECIRAWFTRTDTQRTLCDAGLGYLRREPVVDLSTLEGSQHETRAAVDLFFSVRSVTIEQTGAIAKATAPGTTTPPTPGT